MKKSIQGLYLISLGALSALAVVLRTIALLTEFNFATGYFKGKLLNNLSVTVVITAIALFLTFLIHKKEYKPRIVIGAPKDYVASACVGVTLVISAFELAFSKSGAPLASLQTTERIITAIAAALAAASALYFASSVLLGRSAPRINAAFSIALMLYLVFYALMLYFNVESPINAPVKLCDQMAYVSLAIFFVYETRISLERPLWRMYVISGLAATLLSAYSALPSLIVYFARREIISHTISETLLTLSLFIFALIRTASALTAEEDIKNPIVELVKKMHDERDKEIESAKDASTQYNNNKEENGEEKNANYEFELPKPTEGAE